MPHALGFKDTDIASDSEVLKSYVELLQNAIRDLRSCYVSLKINRLENTLISALKLKSMEFSTYKQELEERYSCIKTYLLTERQKAILTRIISKTTDRTTWYQSLAYIILDKQLENLLDEEEVYLMDNLVHSFKELDKFIDVSGLDFKSDDDFMRFELISNQGAMTPQIIRLDQSRAEKAKRIEKRIDDLLSGDNEVDAYALLSILKKRLGDE